MTDPVRDAFDKSPCQMRGAMDNLHAKSPLGQAVEVRHGCWITSLLASVIDSVCRLDDRSAQNRRDDAAASTLSRQFEVVLHLAATRITQSTFLGTLIGKA